MRLERIGDWVRWQPNYWVNVNTLKYIAIKLRGYDPNPWVLTLGLGEDFHTNVFATESDAVAFAREIMGGEE